MCAGTNTVEVTEINPGLTQVSVHVCWYKHSGSDRNKARPHPGQSECLLEYIVYRSTLFTISSQFTRSTLFTSTLFVYQEYNVC